jgi:hypothetical protein
MTSQATDVSSAPGGQSGAGETVIIGSGGNGGGGGNGGSRESSEFEFIGNRQITPNPLFFHANQQSLLFQTVQETEGKYQSSYEVNALTLLRQRFNVYKINFVQLILTLALSVFEFCRYRIKKNF